MYVEQKRLRFPLSLPSSPLQSLLRCCRFHPEVRWSACERAATPSWCAWWWTASRVRLCCGRGRKRTCWCRRGRPWWRRPTAASGWRTSAGTWWGCTGARRLRTTGWTSSAGRRRSNSMCSVGISGERRVVGFILDCSVKDTW